MTTYGLTAAGFSRKTLAIIQGELEDAYRAEFGDETPVEGDSVFGQLIGIHAEREALLWELAEAVYGSGFPDSATGVALANLVALNGLKPYDATYSTITGAIASGDAGTILLAGKQASVAGTGAKFALTQAYTIGEDGTVEVALRATEKGPLEAPVGTLTVIETPVSGWVGITNPEAANVGRAEETDPELRARRAESLVTAQGGSPKAIEEKLREVEGVIFAGVKHNRTDVEDADGLPPKSIHALVVGGSDEAIVAALYAACSAGIETFGTEIGYIADSFGVLQPIRYSRGASVPMYFIVELTKDLALYPADGDAQVKAAIVAYGDTLREGDDVLNWRAAAAVVGIPGIVTLAIKQGTAADPTLSDNTAIAGNEIASVIAERITVTTL